MTVYGLTSSQKQVTSNGSVSNLSSLVNESGLLMYNNSIGSNVSSNLSNMNITTAKASSEELPQEGTIVGKKDKKRTSENLTEPSVESLSDISKALQQEHQDNKNQKVAKQSEEQKTDNKQHKKEKCDNGKDDDDDNLVDSEDVNDCKPSSTKPQPKGIEICGNGKDDEGDGLVDLDDTQDCRPDVCDNNKDDDGDGIIDGPPCKKATIIVSLVCDRYPMCTDKLIEQPEYSFGLNGKPGLRPNFSFQVEGNNPSPTSFQIPSPVSSRVTADSPKVNITMYAGDFKIKSDQENYRFAYGVSRDYFNYGNNADYYVGGCDGHYRSGSVTYCTIIPHGEATLGIKLEILNPSIGATFERNHFSASLSGLCAGGGTTNVKILPDHTYSLDSDFNRYISSAPCVELVEPHFTEQGTNYWHSIGLKGQPDSNFLKVSPDCGVSKSRDANLQYNKYVLFNPGDSKECTITADFRSIGDSLIPSIKSKLPVTSPSLPASNEICGDGKDNDADGLIDWNDTESCPDSVPSGPEGCPPGYHRDQIEPVCLRDKEKQQQEICNNGKDDDGDGAVDFNDEQSCPPSIPSGPEGCPPGYHRDQIEPVCLKEEQEVPPIVAGPPSVTSPPKESGPLVIPKLEICDNEIDDDNDGLIDAKDIADCQNPLVNPKINPRSSINVTVKLIYPTDIGECYQQSVAKLKERCNVTVLMEGNNPNPTTSKIRLLESTTVQGSKRIAQFPAQHFTIGPGTYTASLIGTDFIPSDYPNGNLVMKSEESKTSGCSGNVGLIESRICTITLEFSVKAEETPTALNNTNPADDSLVGKNPKGDLNPNVDEMNANKIMPLNNDLSKRGDTVDPCVPFVTPTLTVDKMDPLQPGSSSDTRLLEFRPVNLHFTIKNNANHGISGKISGFNYENDYTVKLAPHASISDYHLASLPAAGMNKIIKLSYYNDCSPEPRLITSSDSQPFNVAARFSLSLDKFHVDQTASYNYDDDVLTLVTSGLYSGSATPLTVMGVGSPRDVPPPGKSPLLLISPVDLVPTDDKTLDFAIIIVNSGDNTQYVSSTINQAGKTILTAVPSGIGSGQAPSAVGLFNTVNRIVLPDRGGCDGAIVVHKQKISGSDLYSMTGGIHGGVHTETGYNTYNPFDGIFAHTALSPDKLIVNSFHSGTYYLIQGDQLDAGSFKNIQFADCSRPGYHYTWTVARGVPMNPN
jgi:hypothetical protein